MTIHPSPASIPTQTTHTAFRSAGLGPNPGMRRVTGTWSIPHTEPDPLASIERLLTDEARPGAAWAIMLSYELGGHIEPKARSGLTDPLGFPLAVVQRLGEPIETAEPLGRTAGDHGCTLGAMRSGAGRDGYIRAVGRALELIAAGDVYQVNIAHRLGAPFRGSPESCARALIRAAQPRHGAVMRFEHAGRLHCVCSLSPERFLRLDRATGVLRTEPMKGTRPLDADRAELDRCPKDRAELNMITDLMRNDLGRVCTPGSVRVVDPRRIEPHGSGVLQATAIVEGVIRPNTGLGELLGATFPPGSVTGAPKVRAMQIIDQLEQHPRRSYCGSLMHIDEQGNIESSVAIRTAHIWGDADPDHPGWIIDGRFEYPVGAGIVADSDPESEWAETLVKAGLLNTALGLDPAAVDGPCIQ